MGNLYKPTYTKVDPETGNRVLRKVRKWYGKYRDAEGVLRCVPLSEDKTAAITMLTDLFRRAQWQKAGLLDPAAEHLESSIGSHLDDFKSHLEAKARNEKHIRETLRVINNIVSACRFELLTDLQRGGDGLTKYLATRRQSGASHRTVNADLIAVRSFCRWLLGRKRMHTDPTLGLERLNEAEDPRTERRALTDKEAQRLFATTYRSKRVFRHLSGEDRALLYLLAQRTGLRRGELRHLTSRCFNFADTPATVTVSAATSKRRRMDRLPLPPDVAKAIQKYVAARGADELVWPGSWWQKSAKMLTRDLMDAGISVVDEDGRIIDFHGQRTTFITGLARAGVAPATAQKLARHSDVNLTLGTYTQLDMKELSEAVDKLPKLVAPNKRSKAGPVATTTVSEELRTGDDINYIVNAWPRLTDDVRTAVMKLISDGIETSR